MSESGSKAMGLSCIARQGMQNDDIIRLKQQQERIKFEN